MNELTQNPFGSTEIIRNPEESRVACLLLLDVSSSMEGEPITQLNDGLAQFPMDIKNDSLASKRVEVGIVTFSSEVTLKQDFV